MCHRCWSQVLAPDGPPFPVADMGTVPPQGPPPHHPTGHRRPLHSRCIAPRLTDARFATPLPVLWVRITVDILQPHFFLGYPDFAPLDTLFFCFPIRKWPPLRPVFALLDTLDFFTLFFKCAFRQPLECSLITYRSKVQPDSDVVRSTWIFVLEPTLAPKKFPSFFRSLSPPPDLYCLPLRLRSMTKPNDGARACTTGPSASPYFL